MRAAGPRRNSSTISAELRGSVPEEPGPVRTELNFSPQASLATVRSPEAPAPERVGVPPSPRPDCPSAFRDKFACRRFINLDPPDFLDYPGTELVLIGASPEVTRERGLSLHPRR